MKQATFLLLIVQFLFFSNGYSQPTQFEKGQADINLGIGFVTPIAGSGLDVKIPPFTASIDFGISKRVSLGVYAGIVVAGTGGESLVHAVAGARGLYHFHLAERLDTYTGLMLGYNSLKSTIDESAGVFGFGAIVGGRYRFTKNIGGFLEFGYTVSVVNIGVNIRIPAKALKVE